jgi:hypothetical protein
LCTDGDPGYSARHKAFFLEWYSLFTAQGLDATVAWLPERRSPIPRSFQNIIDSVFLQAILGLGDVFDDIYTIGRMRDCYPVKLFTFENDLTCLTEDNTAGAVYIIIFTLLYSCLRVKEFTIPQRLFRARLAFDLLQRLLSLNDFSHLKGITGQWTKKSRALTLASDGTWMKIINTAIGLLVFLQLSSETGCGDRFGIHTLENFIGLIRRLCAGDDRPEEVRRVVARTILAHNFMLQLSIPVKHRQRENCGGVTFAFSSADTGAP